MSDRDKTGRAEKNRDPRDRDHKEKRGQYGQGRPPRAPGGERRHREEGRDRPAWRDRPRQEGDERGERRSFRQDDLAAIRDLDEDILRLIMKRAQLLRQAGDKGRLGPENEKSLRLSWEQKAAHFSKDSRLARDLFVMLQAVEPLSRGEEDQAFYNLAPSRRPVDVDLPAPADPWEIRCWLALSAASGAACSLRSVALTDGVIDAVKALNQLDDGRLRWEEDGTVTAKPGKGLLSGLDKVVHVGGDALSFWLVLALGLGLPCRLKIMGSPELSFLNLASLRRFLPEMGVRLTNVIPGQDGLPVRLESAGMPPETIALPDDLPWEFAAALALTTPFRPGSAGIRLPRALQSGQPGPGESALLTAAHVLRQAGLGVRYAEDRFDVDPGAVAVPAEPALAMDVALSASLLALPALSGGKARLAGVWPQAGPESDTALKLLAQAGLDVRVENGSVHSAQTAGLDKETGRAPAPPSPGLCGQARNVAPDLLPLLLLLAALAAKSGQKAVLLPPALLSRRERETWEAFLFQLGWDMDEEGALRRAAQDSATNRPSWLAPDAMWAVGLALAAFLRPNLRLSNPGVLSRRFPPFWTLYNTLPAPDLSRKATPAHAEGKADGAQDDNPGRPVAPVRPVRKRIIASGVFAELPAPPAQDSLDDAPPAPILP